MAGFNLPPGVSVNDIPGNGPDEEYTRSERKHNERGLPLPTYADLLTRLLRAAFRLEPTKAAIVGVHWERWISQQPHGRWSETTHAK